MKLWVCGKLKGEWKPDGSIWEFQGVFSTETLADKACRTGEYFIFPASLDKELPDASVPTIGGRYPRMKEIEKAFRKQSRVVRKMARDLASCERSARKSKLKFDVKKEV